MLLDIPGKKRKGKEEREKEKKKEREREKEKKKGRKKRVEGGGESKRKEGKKEGRRQEGRKKIRKFQEFCHNTFHIRTQTKCGLPGTQELKLNLERWWEKKCLNFPPESTHPQHTPISEYALSPRLKGQASRFAQYMSDDRKNVQSLSSYLFGRGPRVASLWLWHHLLQIHHLSLGSRAAGQGGVPWKEGEGRTEISNVGGDGL